MDIYYKNKFNMTTSISLICKQNYKTDINNTHSVSTTASIVTTVVVTMGATGAEAIYLPKKRLAKVERSKMVNN